MRKFRPATITGKRRETADSVVLTLAVPREDRDDFRYRHGQHLPVRAEIDGRSVRRTYSICAGAGEQRLRLGVRVQPGGVLSNYLAALEPGDTLEVMPPYGHFNTALDPAVSKTYAAFVAGSGITPILSIVTTTLETEPDSRFIVFYGNRKRASTMFVEDLWALKNRFRKRLALHFVMSQEPGDIPLYEGRLDAAKLRELHTAFLSHARPDEVFLCGPNPMIDELTRALTDLGYAGAAIHSERFRPGLKGEAPPPRAPVDAPADGTEVVVVMDGQRQSFHMQPNAESVLDAAAEAGIELPYSCKGGVCSTCRVKLRRGEVDMAANYALEPWELDAGFILSCQARPLSKELELDYDEA